MMEIYRVGNTTIIKGRNRLLRYLRLYCKHNPNVLVEQWQFVSDEGIVQWQVIINP